MRTRRLTPLRQFLETEAGGGVVLVVATVIALAWANSPWSSTYEDVWHGMHLGPDALALDLDLRHWVNDALMTLFFFLIGLEIKRELVAGELRDPRAALLPGVAALGGMVVPAAVFLLVAGGGEEARGWGVPMATDIAFAIGVLALLGRRVPAGLKLFLLTLAIVDDIGAIVVIAVFYASDVQPAWLLVTAAALAFIAPLRRVGVRHPAAYLPLAVVAWYATFRAGVHPTIAAVALGLVVPVDEGLEARLHPFSSFLVVPVFALANAGVTLDAGTSATSSLALAVALGLVVGKSIGITGATLIALSTRATRLPTGVDRVHVAGAGALGGIGFTVALFIASLAFTEPALEAQAKVGILMGSVVSGALGAAVLGVRGARAGTSAVESAL